MPYFTGQHQRNSPPPQDPVEAYAKLIQFLDSPIMPRILASVPSASHEIKMKIDNVVHFMSSFAASDPEHEEDGSIDSQSISTEGEFPYLFEALRADHHHQAVNPSSADHRGGSLYELRLGEIEAETLPALDGVSPTSQHCPAMKRSSDAQDAQGAKKHFCSNELSLRQSSDSGIAVASLRKTVRNSSMLPVTNSLAVVDSQLSQCSYQRSRQPVRTVENFGEARFSALASGLRIRIWKMDKSETMLHVWEVLSLIRTRICVREPAPVTESYMAVPLQREKPTDVWKTRLRQHIENFEVLILESSSYGHWYQVARRVRLRDLAVEFRAVKSNMTVNGTRETANNLFLAQLFPDTVFATDQVITRQMRDYREKRKRKVDYWVRLGTRLLDMVERFGHGVLLLTLTVTDKQLYHLRHDQVPDLLDYMDRCYPDLYEHLTDLSEIMAEAVEGELSYRVLVIEKMDREDISVEHGNSIEGLFKISDPPVG